MDICGLVAVVVCGGSGDELMVVDCIVVMNVDN